MIPWGHHKVIMDKYQNNINKAIFFVRKTIANNWSREMLENFVDTDLYERQGQAITNFYSALPQPHGDLVQEITKDPYTFDFVSIAEVYREKELKNALENNIAKFLLELGSGFAYMGREFRIKVGSTEQFLDMLFYNTKLHCYVVVEIKTRKFEEAVSDNLALTLPPSIMSYVQKQIIQQSASSYVRQKIMCWLNTL